MFITGSCRKKMEEQERWAREEEEWTRRHEEEEEDTKSRERRGRMAMGEPCAQHCWEKLARGEGHGGNCDRGRPTMARGQTTALITRGPITYPTG
jgi:hypothetical protein